MKNARPRIVLDPAFPRSYEIDAPVDDQPPLKKYGASQGALIAVRAQNGEAFAVSIRTSRTAIEVATWFDPNFFLVLTTGELIDTCAPQNRVKLAALEGHGVSYHLLLPDQQLALLGFCGGLLCYGVTGLLWAIEAKLCGYEPIIDTFENELLIVARDPETQQLRRRRFALASGEWLGDAAVL